MPETSLEKALERFQTAVETVLGNAGALAKRLKRLKAAAQSGDLREIDKAVPELRELAGALQSQTAALAFEFDETCYFPDAFLAELEAAAEAEGLNVFVRDGKLYCYPLLVRVRGSERAARIGAKTERGIRPSALAARLKQLRSRPPLLGPEAFLALLHRAWSHCAAANESPVLRLAEIYDVLTLMPGTSKDYTRDDFARDLYMLDSSGISKTGGGVEFRFSASTGTRSAADTFLCIAEDGSEKRYYGISFTQPS
jgi:hypothetical protein